MEFKRPKPKKNSGPKDKLISPYKIEKKIVGVFNGQFVFIPDWDSMNYIYESGCFGKGTLSKGQPNYHITNDDISKIMLEHQFENHAKWNANSHSSLCQKYLGSFRRDFKLSLMSVTQFLESSFNDNKQETWKSWKEKHMHKSESISQRINLPVIEFTSDENDYTDEVFRDLVNDILQSRQIKKPTNSVPLSEEVIVLNTSFNFETTVSSIISANACLRKLPFPPQENLNLGLEESFFLKSVVGCLTIVDLNLSEIGIQDLWEQFNSVDKNFTERYITYNYYRSKGWVVRSGLKFGGDYLLYKDGPAYYHASYLVKVLDRKNKPTWREFIAMNRLVETFNKDLLLCQVQCNAEEDKDSFPNVLNNYSVQEVLVRRWFPSKERFSQENTSS